MPGLGRTDEVVVRNLEVAPGLAEPLDDAVRMLLGTRNEGTGELFDLFTMLVGAGEKARGLTAGTVVAREDVGDYRRVGVAEVRHVVDVIDGRRDVKGR